MKNSKTNILVALLFVLCGVVGLSNISKKSSDNIINEIEDGVELIEGDSFLNYGVIKGLKNTDYELSINIEPSNHSSKITWTSDYPELVSVEAKSNDKAVIRRLEDYRGYVNIKASIDGLEATCKVYSISRLKYLDVSLSENTTSLSVDGAYYDSYDKNNNSYHIVVDVKVSHDLVFFDKIANEGNYSNEELSELINGENSINLNEPNFLRIENIKTNFKLSNSNNYESYTLTYEYYNQSLDYDWEFEYYDFYSYICTFTQFIQTTSLYFDNDSLII